MRPQKLRKPRKDPRLHRIRELVNPISWAEGQSNFWANGRYTVLGHLSKWHFAKKLSLTKVEQHLAGLTTVYFTGNCNHDQCNETFIVVDTDAGGSHGSGSSAGAIAFNEHLKKKWPNYYYEPSTNGVGCHGYLILNMSFWDIHTVRATLDHFQRWLNQEAEGFDVAMIEVKGRPGYVDWSETTKGEVDDWSLGVQCKLPRSFDALDTTKVSVAYLQKLPVNDEPKKNSDELRVGSVTFIPKRYLDRKKAEQRAKKVRNRYNAVCGSRKFKLVREDVTCWEMLFPYLIEHQRDGAMPHAWVKAIWDGLYKQGIFKRQLNNSRYAAIVKMYSALGLIDWQDNTYYFYRDDDGGRIKKGKCCYWTGSEQYVATLEGHNSNKREEEDHGDSAAIMNVPLFLVPVEVLGPDACELPNLCSWKHRMMAVA